MELRDIDLNLLVVFNQLLTERRVSAVADTLGLTQPAVSNALKRLRKLLGDELFVRTGHGMAPTPYALQLAGPVADALGTLHGALNQQLRFDPANSQRSFTLAVTDIGEIYFLPVLMDALAERAPGVSISTVRNSGATLTDDMESGKLDLAIGLLPHLQAGFYQRRLFHQRYVCMFREQHPAVSLPLTLENFLALEHVVVVSGGTGHSEVDAMLERAGIQRRIRLTVPHFIAVGHILQRTDMIATVPERFAARCLAPFGLTAVPHPVSLPDIAIKLFWHARYHRDPASRWLRQLVFELFSESARPESSIDNPAT